MPISIVHTSVALCGILTVTLHTISLSTGSCGGEITIRSGATSEISTPNHPSNYPTNLLCRWVVRSSVGRLSRISFSSFRTERLYDTVRVCSGLHCDDTSLIASLNGSLSGSQVFVSRSNLLTVELQTDGLIGASGFRATASNTDVPGPTLGMY